jgi:hypothetical protein
MESASVNARHRRIELITGAARRRRWSAAEKSAMIAESFAAWSERLETGALAGDQSRAPADVAAGRLARRCR